MISPSRSQRGGYVPEIPNGTEPGMGKSQALGPHSPLNHSSGTLGFKLCSLLGSQGAMVEEEEEFLFRAPQMVSLRFGLSHSRVKLGVFLLLVQVFLPGTYSFIQKSVYFSVYEIIIPRRLANWKRENHPEKIQYSFFMKGRWHVMSLKQKEGLFVQNFPVYTYSNGIPSLDISSVQGNCYYDGYFIGDRGSFASISTCSGLKGILIIEMNAFSILPVKSSRKFEHALYRLSRVSGDTCGVKNRESQKFWAKPESFSLMEFSSAHFTHAWSYPKYLEIFIVVDNIRFQMWDKNVTTTTQTLIDVLALVNHHMKQINLEVVLAGVEIWSERNLVHISQDLQETLYDFNQWQASELPKRATYSVAHLITGQDVGSHQGHAFVGTVCASRNLAGVEVFHQEDIPRFAALLAHELGHNLGMKHDHPDCTCPDSHFCSMHELITLKGTFSNCSLKDFYKMLGSSQGTCLYNKPKSKSPFGRQYCGNKIVEDGEQCDCGSAQECLKDQCCLPSCQLREGSECAFGPCCQNCRFAEATTPCRPKVDECDLPEYCNGTSRWCQPDTYKQDGFPCRDQSYCYQGRCGSLEKQCIELFGKDSRPASNRCYHMNTQGNRYGNCGIKWHGPVQVFSQCQPQDIMCGKLYCENIQTLPHIKNHYAFFQLLMEDTWCWGVDLYNALDMPNGGLVQEGTSCGHKKICINQSCLDIEVVSRDNCSLDKCHGKGICNNLKNCHCNYGYEPPTCQFHGQGGSLDSGPSPRFKIVHHKLASLIWFIMVFAWLLMPIVFVGVCSYWKTDKPQIRGQDNQDSSVAREDGEV